MPMRQRRPRTPAQDVRHPAVMGWHSPGAIEHSSGRPNLSQKGSRASRHGNVHHQTMHWYDDADAKAGPVGLAVFVLVGVVFLIAGLGWWSLLTAFALGCAALNLAAARSRARRRRGARSR